MTEPPIAPVDAPARTIDRERARALLPARPADSSKGTFGNVLNVAGSTRYRGAACLSSLAALRAGAGYATLACVAEVASSVAALTPDVVTAVLPARRGCLSRAAAPMVARIIPAYRALAIGCGLSGPEGIVPRSAGTRDLLAFFALVIGAARDADIPTVIDADGLNLLALNPGLPLPPRVVLTPHPKELSRLLGVGVEAIQAGREAFARQAARDFRATVVLKGHRSVIADAAGCWVNETGNSALAKAGTGDVLTGTVAAFLAQGLAPTDAACLAVYLHGRAGELASAELGEAGVLASDLPLFIPKAFLSLR